jgi:hypothetical protein
MAVEVPSRVFAIPGFTGTIPNHWGVAGAVGGSDIFAPRGSSIVSMVDGTVNFISTQATAGNSGGNAVQIKGVDGLTYYYAHMENTPLVKQGQTVKAGQKLGTLGDSGNAKGTGAHLHIGIGKSINVGVGAQGGIGTGYNAVDLLRALQKQDSANSPSILDTRTQDALANRQPTDVSSAIPTLHFVPSVPGFTEARTKDILLNIKEAIAAGVDPFVWLGIVAHESSFDPNAKNPRSGACGYAQIYPCINLSPEENIREGLKRFKSFLSGCGGDTNCAMNKYSGGGGQAYITKTTGFINAIKGANPGIASISGSDIGDVSDGDNGDVSGDDTIECPPIKVELPAGITIPFPDFGCMVFKAVNDLQDQMGLWWSTWQTENFTNIIFILGGILFLALGIIGIVQDQGGFSMAGIAKKQMGKQAAKAIG